MRPSFWHQFGLQDDDATDGNNHQKSEEESMSKKSSIDIGEISGDFDFYSPRGYELSEALSGSSVLGIGAHSDDLDFMCLSAIEKGKSDARGTFFGIIASDGRGSSRSKAFASFSDDDFIALRRNEQREAASASGYRGALQMAYTSAEIRK